MKRLITLVVLVGFVSNTAAQTRAPRQSGAARPVALSHTTGQLLPIKRVILYSNGVAFFERRGKVNGRAEIDLPFKQSQVDDVLKSMIVLDLGQGRIGAVSYNSSAPPAARLNSIPFSIESGTENSAEGGLAGVVRQFQGARVEVTTASRTATGAILTVEERRSQIDSEKPPVVAHRLVIASASGEIHGFDLAEVRAVRLLDETARHDIAEFADASASARRRDAKTIEVTSDGAGEREISVSYTVAAPIWKTSYRVVLDEAGSPFFQGWAIVDNLSDEDWKGVSLSLVSGTPVSFIQPLQQPLYRHRPVISIPEDLQLEPQVYDESVGYNMGGGSPTLGGRPGVGGGVGSGAGSGAGAGRSNNMSVAPSALDGLLESTRSQLSANGPVTSLSDAIRSEESVKTAATGAEVGDLFEYRIDQPVTVERDRSALIPIIQTRMEGERVSIYNEAARADRPMGGLRLKNTSSLTFEGGPLTVLDGNAYAGEAIMERLKPGEERFISFALDLGTLVTTRVKNDRERAFLVRVVNGVFQAHYYQTDQKSYTITNQTSRPRVVFVEHPVRKGWKLSDKTAKPFETTASFYRFRLELAPRATVELAVTERRAIMDSYTISNLTPREIEVFVSRNYVDDPSRAALEKIIEIKGRIAANDARAQELEAEASEIAADQARLRENIKALGQTGGEARQLIARYVAKAGEQESRIERISAERKKAAAERAHLQAELDAAIRTLNIDREL